MLSLRHHMIFRMHYPQSIQCLLGPRSHQGKNYIGPIRYQKPDFLLCSEFSLNRNPNTLAMDYIDLERNYVEKLAAQGLISSNLDSMPIRRLWISVSTYIGISVFHSGFCCRSELCL